jgi:hypothetical protein
MEGRWGASCGLRALTILSVDRAGAASRGWADSGRGGEGGGGIPWECGVDGRMERDRDLLLLPPADAAAAAISPLFFSFPGEERERRLPPAAVKSLLAFGGRADGSAPGRSGA